MLSKSTTGETPPARGNSNISSSPSQEEPTDKTTSAPAADGLAAPTVENNDTVTPPTEVVAT